MEQVSPGTGENSYDLSDPEVEVPLSELNGLDIGSDSASGVDTDFTGHPGQEVLDRIKADVRKKVREEMGLPASTPANEPDPPAESGKIGQELALISDEDVLDDTVAHIIDPRIKDALIKVRKLDKILEQKNEEELATKRKRLLEQTKIRDEFNLLLMREDQRDKLEKNKHIKENLDRFFTIDMQTKHYQGILLPNDSQAIGDPFFQTETAAPTDPSASESYMPPTPTPGKGSSSALSSTSIDTKRSHKSRSDQPDGKDFIRRNIELAAHANDVVALTDEEQKRLQELLSDMNETEAFGAPKPELENSDDLPALEHQSAGSLTGRTLAAGRGSLPPTAFSGDLDERDRLRSIEERLWLEFTPVPPPASPAASLSAASSNPSALSPLEMQMMSGMCSVQPNSRLSENRAPPMSREASNKPAASAASSRSTATGTATHSSAHLADAGAEPLVSEQPPSEEQLDRLGERTLQELRDEREMRLRLASLELELSDMHAPRIIAAPSLSAEQLEGLVSDSLQALTYTVGAQSTSGALSTVEEEDVTPQGSPRPHSGAESASTVRQPSAQSALGGSSQCSETNQNQNQNQNENQNQNQNQNEPPAAAPAGENAGPPSAVMGSALVPFRDGETRALVTSLSVEAPDGRGRVNSAYSWNADTNAPRLDTAVLQELLEEARREGVTYLPPSSFANFQLASEDTELEASESESQRSEQSQRAPPAPDLQMSRIPEADADVDAEATALSQQIETGAGVRPPSASASGRSSLPVSATRTLSPTATVTMGGNGTSYPMQNMTPVRESESESWHALQPERVQSAREQVANRLLNGRRQYSPPVEPLPLAAPASKPGTPLRAPLPPLADAQQLHSQSRNTPLPLPADSAALPNIRRGGLNANANSVTISVPSTPSSSRSASSRYNS